MRGKRHLFLTGERRAVPVLPAFEENGVEILRRSLASNAPFLLMDELVRWTRQEN